MDKTVLLAQRWVTVPQKDGADWFVWWLSGASAHKETFTTAEDAYAFYYSKVANLAKKLKTRTK